MSQETSIELFENAKIRVVWDDEQEKYFFSVVDVVGVLTEQDTARGATIYWAVRRQNRWNVGWDYIKPQDELPFEDEQKNEKF